MRCQPPLNSANISARVAIAPGQRSWYQSAMRSLPPPSPALAGRVAGERGMSLPSLVMAVGQMMAFVGRGGCSILCRARRIAGASRLRALQLGGDQLLRVVGEAGVMEDRAVRRHHDGGRLLL